MRKLKLLFLIFIATTLPGHAQLLWKISGNGLKQPSYLFGTHHLIPIQFLDSVPGLYPAFNSAKMVVSEVVLNNIDATSKVQQAAILPDTITMKGLLKGSDYEFANEELKNVLKMSLDELSKMHPSLLSTLYQLELYKKIAHFDDNTKSDSYFQTVAYEKEMPVVGLETIEKQIELLFPKKDLKKEAESFITAMRNKEDLIADLQRMNQLYRAGDLEGLEKLSVKTNETYGITTEEQAEMLDNRNLEWMKQLPALMKENPCFIAVGALHLTGKTGIINLLRKQGYKVTSVSKMHK